MDSVSIWLVGALFVVVSTAVGLLGLELLGPFIRARIKVEHNDVSGSFATRMGTVYAVLLAFVVLAVWQRYSAADASVNAEAAALVSAYRAAQNLPQPMRTDATGALRAYATRLPEEWVSHGLVTPHVTPDPLNPVWTALRDARDVPGSNVSSATETAFQQLEVQRHVRHLASERTLPNVFWWVLIAGGLGSILISYLLAFQPMWLHRVLTGMLSLMIGSVLFLIFALNSPFVGQVHVSSDPITHALLQFDALDRTT